MATTRFVQLRQPRDPTLVHMYQQGMCWKYASSLTKLCFCCTHNMSQNFVSVAVKTCQKTVFFEVKYVGVVGSLLTTASAIAGTSILGMF